MNPETSPNAILPGDDPLRHHTYDGIQEFDKRLPNWWLWTLHGAIIFSFIYWFYFHWSGLSETRETRLERKMAQIALAAATSGGKDLDDAQLWAMSRDPVIAGAGKGTFLSTCAACHGPEGYGGIGVNLRDSQWVHGGNPTNILATITKGVLAKGMPAWGPVLGPGRVTEATAFVLSWHTPPEAQ